MKSEYSHFFKEFIPLTLILVSLDYFVFQNQFIYWQPSPFWLLVLFPAPRYGSACGLIAGLTASVIYFFNMDVLGYSWQDLLHRHPSSLVLPGMFLLAGLYLGTLRESYAKRIESLENSVQSLKAAFDKSEIKCAQLERDRVNMEKRIAGQTGTLLALNDNFKRLAEAPTEGMLMLLLEAILREELNGESCGIWRVRKGEATHLAGNFQGDIPPLALWAGKNRKVATAADWSRQNSHEAPGADLAALIFDDNSERIVVALANVPFINMTRNSALHFGLLAERTGIVLKNIHAQESLRRAAVQDTALGLMSEAYLRKRLDEEISLARRHKTQLGLLCCSVASASENMIANMEIVLSCSIRACIRLSDGLAYFHDQKAFILILPQCDLKGAEIVRRKIEDNMRILDLEKNESCPPFNILWSSHVADGSIKGETILTELFSEMASAGDTA